MINHFFTHIRRQPRSVRDSYAFFGAMLITFVVFVFWSIHMYSTFVSSGDVLEEVEAREQVATVSQGPFSGFSRFVKDMFDNSVSVESSQDIFPANLQETSRQDGGAGQGAVNTYNWFE